MTNKDLTTLPAVDADALIAKAIDNKMPVEHMQALLDMRLQIKAEQAREAYFVALAKFQAECPTIIKDTVIKGKGKYAKLELIVQTIAATEQACQFSHRFETEPLDNGGVTVTCIVTHTQGHSEQTSVTIPPVGAVMSREGKAVQNAAQVAGVAITYGRRYALTGAFGIVTADEDTDANIARPADYERITENQAADLITLLRDAEADTGAFLRWVSSASSLPVESITAMPADFYDRAVAKVREKLAAK